jgi:hypothetical protein
MASIVTALEMVRRHVREGEVRLARQEALVDEIRAKGMAAAMPLAEDYAYYARTRARRSGVAGEGTAVAGG